MFQGTTALRVSLQSQASDKSATSTELSVSRNGRGNPADLATRRHDQMDEGDGACYIVSTGRGYDRDFRGLLGIQSPEDPLARPNPLLTSLIIISPPPPSSLSSAVLSTWPIRYTHFEVISCYRSDRATCPRLSRLACN